MSGGARSSIVNEALRSSERNRAMLAHGARMDDRAELVEAKPDADASYGAPESEQSVSERVLSTDLVDTVTNHIIPRLLLASLGDARGNDRVADARRLPTPEEIATLAELAVAQDVRGAMAQVEAKLQEGLSLDSVLLDLISPAGSLLGEQWLSDDKSFTQVTLGVGTLHRMLANLRQRFRSAPSHRGLVVLATPPGEQHTLAIHVLGDLMLNAGWDAVVEPNIAADDLVAMVASEPVVMVGISVSCSELVEPIAPMVARVRDSSLNRKLLVMLGGAVDLASPAESVGAVHCPNARIALALLEHEGGISL